MTAESPEESAGREPESASPSPSDVATRTRDEFAVDESTTPDVASSEEHRPFLSYEGAVVPRFLAVLWIAFLIWSVVYVIRYVPESTREWFPGE